MSRCAAVNTIHTYFDSGQFLQELRHGFACQTENPNLDKHGFGAIELSRERPVSPDTRLNPDRPWAQWVVASIGETAQQEVAVMPNLGGNLPNNIFASVVELPTIWLPGTRHEPQQPTVHPERTGETSDA